MGYVYYGNYAQYFEVARVEALRAMGMSYKEMEDQGILLPVVDFHVRYFKPAYYDDELLIKTCIKEIPSTKIKFYNETYNTDGELLNKAEVILVFVNQKTGKPCKAPDSFLKLFT